MALVCHQHLSRTGGEGFTPPHCFGGGRLIFFMDDVVFFIGFCVQASLAYCFLTLRIPQKEMLILKL